MGCSTDTLCTVGANCLTPSVSKEGVAREPLRVFPVLHLCSDLLVSIWGHTHTHTHTHSHAHTHTKGIHTHTHESHKERNTHPRLGSFPFCTFVLTCSSATRHTFGQNLTHPSQDLQMPVCHACVSPAFHSQVLRVSVLVRGPEGLSLITWSC